jgi:hypothetical protein
MSNSKINDWIIFSRNVGRSWPAKKFWRKLRFNEGNAAMSTDEDIMNILTSGPHTDWINDEDLDSSSDVNSDFQNAIDEKNIQYFYPYLNKLFKDGWPPKTGRASVAGRKRRTKKTTKRNTKGKKKPRKSRRKI